MSVRSPSFAPGSLAPGLRVGTHNIHGFTQALDPARSWLPALRSTRAHDLVYLWSVVLRLHVVCIQETWLCASTQPSVESLLAAAAASLGVPGYTCFWAHASGGAARQGVGILVRTDMIRPGCIEVGGCHSCDDGRRMSLALDWAGHRLTIMCLYMPNASQSAYLQDAVSPWLQDHHASGRTLMMCGDLNMVFDARLDTRPGCPRLGPAPALGTPADTGGVQSDIRVHGDAVATAFQAACHRAQVVDAYRHVHPTARAFTCFHHARCRLLDRILLSSAALPFVHQCLIDWRTVSDHRPVVLHLRPAVATHAARNPLRRHRVSFDVVPALVDQFKAWVRREEHAAPLEHADILVWWPAFKARLTGRLAALNAEARALQFCAVSVMEADAALQAAFQAIEQEDGASALGMHRLLQARMTYASALSQASAPAAARARHAWLHENEVVHGAMSRVLAHAATSIPSLRTPGGGLAVSPTAVADTLVSHYSRISAQPVTSASAVEQVLAAVHQHATPVDSAAARQAGSPTVTAAQVHAACKHMSHGTAPGPDGLPAKVWRLGGGCMYPLMARFFTAIGECGRMPAGFTHGAVRPLCKDKDGDRAAPVNYRPITLLNTDYRVLARVLSSRLTALLARAIGPEQSGFLPGRCIGDNIHFLQLLPAALRAQAGVPSMDDAAVLAFLDFAKAFDTVDRDFLYHVMRATGAGAMVPWVQLMLSDCTACVVVNGECSRSAVWLAGVRQGCPLSPSLYLFVPWAMSCWLQSDAALGISVGGRRHVSLHFADDTQAMLRSLHSLPALLARMAVFGDASGQRVNVAKSMLMRVGRVVGSGAEAHSLAQGMSVVSQCKALGVTLSNDCHTIMHTSWWDPTVLKVTHAYDKLARLRLSAMGRGMAASAYGVSTLLYRAEFQGMPPPSVLHRLRAASLVLVDKGKAPSQSVAHTLPGVARKLLPGSPSQGGFGLLPWEEHIQARHAVWACKLLRGLCLHGTQLPPQMLARRARRLAALRSMPATPRTQRDIRTLEMHPACPAWVHLAALVLVHASPHHHPSFLLLSMARVQPAGEGPEARLPGPLARMVRALRALPQLSFLGATAALPSLVPSAAPMWGHPLLPSVDGHMLHGMPGPMPLSLHEWVRTGAAALSSLPAALHLGMIPYMSGIAVAAGVLASVDAGLGAYVRMSGFALPTLEQWRSLWACVPPGLQAAIRGGGVDGAPPAPAMQHSAVASVLDGVGWRAGSCPPTYLLDGGSVKEFTNILTAGHRLLRAQRHQQFVSVAAHGPSYQPQPGPGMAHVLVAQAAVLLPPVAGLLAPPVVPVPVVVPAPHVAHTQPAFAGVLRRLWGVPCSNHIKEPLWRLSVNGVPGAGGHHIVTEHPCPCGWRVPPVPGPHPPGTDLAELRAGLLRDHCFWSCPVAAAVLHEVQSGLPAGMPLHMSHVWLVVSPCPAVMRQAVWDMVAMCALAAMWRGRRIFWKRHLQLHQDGPPHADASVQASACRTAAGLFWSFLQDFAAMHSHDVESWPAYASLPADHSFLCVVDTHGSRRLGVRLP